VLALDPSNTRATRLIDSVARGQRFRRGALIAGAVVLLAAGGVGAAAMIDEEKPAVVVLLDAGPLDAAPAVVEAPADAAPAPVVVVDAVADAGTKRQGKRPVVPTIVDAAPAPVAPPEVKVEAPAVDAGPRTGKLLVKIGPTCQVSIDGRRVGSSPMTQPVELEAGHHKVVCENPATGLKVEKNVEIFPGRTDTLRDVLVAKVVVSIQTQNEVRVDGVQYRRGAKVELTAGSHRVERLEGGRVVDTRYVQIPTVPCILRDLPELNCQ
jgi:hypothetical protein